MWLKRDNVEREKEENFQDCTNREENEIALEIPRDRKGKFEPQIIKKYQKDISRIEEKHGRFIEYTSKNNYFYEKKVLRKIGTILKKIPQKNVRIGGYTDSVPVYQLRCKSPVTV